MQGIINSMLRDFLLKAPVVYKLTCVWMWMLMLPLSIGVGVFIAKKLWVVWTFMLICIVGILISDIIVLA